MNPAHLETLFAPSDRATDRILEQTSRLTPAQFTHQPREDTCSIQATLAHMLEMEVGWRVRLATGTSDFSVPPETVPTIAALRQRRVEERIARRGYLATVDAGDPDRPARFVRQGTMMEATPWHLLLHLITHSTQHRSEVAERLTKYSYSPGELDLFTFLYEQP